MSASSDLWGELFVLSGPTHQQVANAPGDQIAVFALHRPPLFPFATGTQVAQNQKQIL